MHLISKFVPRQIGRSTVLLITTLESTLERERSCHAFQKSWKHVIPLDRTKHRNEGIVYSIP